MTDTAYLPIPPARDTVRLSGGNTHRYADAQSPAWLVLERPNDGTDPTQWDNLIEVRYYDEHTGRYRLAFHLNEKGLLRVRGCTPSDVPARIMAHPDARDDVALLEVTHADNTSKILQVYRDHATAHVPIEVPYLRNPAGEQLYLGTTDPATDDAYTDHRPTEHATWYDTSEGILRRWTGHNWCPPIS